MSGQTKDAAKTGSKSGAVAAANTQVGNPIALFLRRDRDGLPDGWLPARLPDNQGVSDWFYKFIGGHDGAGCLSTVKGAKTDCNFIVSADDNGASTGVSLAGLTASEGGVEEPGSGNSGGWVWQDPDGLVKIRLKEKRNVWQLKIRPLVQPTLANRASGYYGLVCNLADGGTTVICDPSWQYNP